MTDAIYQTEILGEPELAPAAGVSRTPFSWSAAAAGAFAATAVTLMIIALGSGIGLSFSSPYSSGPSAKTLTIAAAVWLVMAQTMGFATGGYLAARLRSPAYDGVRGETTFRDAAQGLVMWSIGAVAMAAAVTLLGLYAAGATAHVAASAASGNNNAPSETGPVASMDYFIDVMFRPGANAAAANGAQPSTVGTAAPGAQPTLNPEARAEVTRVLVRSLAQGAIDDNDRGYLAQVVSERTGLPPDEAQRRVATVEGKAREAVKETADNTAKAGAYFAFWSFMSLLFGAAAATLAGILGGDLRDAEGRLGAA